MCKPCEKCPQFSGYIGGSLLLKSTRKNVAAYKTGHTDGGTATHYCELHHLPPPLFFSCNVGPAFFTMIIVIFYTVMESYVFYVDMMLEQN